jgi:hypothetical protein
MLPLIPINTNLIAEELQRGCKYDLDRREQAHKNLIYYRGKHHTFFASQEYTGMKPAFRPSMFLKFVVDHISNLYKSHPNRVIIGNEPATLWLQQIYNDNHMWAKMLDAERLTAITDVAAFQCCGTDNPKKPIKIRLWSADCFLVYKHHDDPICPAAVVTMDKYYARKRFSVWTDTKHEVWIADTEEEAEEKVTRIVSEENPYGRLPFSFVHFNYPTLDFWSGGPGCNLRQANHYIDDILSQLGGSVKYACNPILIGRNLSPEWRPPRQPEAGEILTPEGVPNENGAVVEPDLGYLQPSYGFAETAWLDIVNFVNHTLECNGIPESAVRMVQSVARSGASIMSEQYPLIQWAKSRQPMFKHYECDLAKLVFDVAAVHLKSNGIVSDMQREASEGGFELSITYKNQYSDVPGAERDRQSDWEVAEGYKSKIMVHMERTGCTKEEALAHFKEVTDDNAVLDAMLVLPQNVDEKLIEESDDLRKQEEEEDDQGSNTNTGTENSDDYNL